MMTCAPHAIREALTELHKVMLSGVNWGGRYTQDQIRVTLRPRDGAALDTNAVRSCVEYTVQQAESDAYNAAPRSSLPYLRDVGSIDS
jgi:hypothetical protein